MGKSYRYTGDDDSDNRKERYKRDTFRGRMVSEEEIEFQDQSIRNYFQNQNNPSDNG